MARLRAHQRQEWTEERGSSIVELLVAMLVGGIVVVIPLVLISTVFKSTNEVTSRTEAASRAQLALRGLITDLRQATAVTITSASGSASAVLAVPVRTAPGAGQTVAPASQTVTWTCTAGGTCGRRVGSGADVEQVADVDSADFTATSASGATTTTNPTFVSVTMRTRLRLAARESTQRTMTVSDGVGLRNFTG